MTSVYSENKDSSTIKFVHQLRYDKRMELCALLDLRDQWKSVGGLFDLSDLELNKYSKALYWRNGSPAEELLSRLDERNVTVLNLFKALAKLKYFRAMEILKQYVPSKYHQLMQDKSFETVSFKPATGGETLSESNRENIRSSVRNNELGSIGERATVPKLAERSNFGVDRCLPYISYDDMLKITKNWDKEKLLGRGGFGTVYKGIWKNTEIAVKRPIPLHVNREANTSLLSLKELEYVTDHKHPNIVSLLAYSQEDGKYILIFEYMRNGSLEYKLHSTRNRVPLSWFDRFNIAKGTARGLQFLHQLNEKKPLVHGDIKSANILLDDHLEPKIADFGLAREGSSCNSHITVSKPRGTRIYSPPEYIQSKQLSTKVDTYSYGVVLCEMVTGMQPIKNGKLLREVIEERDENKLQELMDSKAGIRNPYNIFIFSLLIRLARKCINLEKNLRPEMIEVFEELDKYSDYVLKNRTINLSPNILIHQPIFDRRSSSPTNYMNQTTKHQLPFFELRGASPTHRTIGSTPPIMDSNAPSVTPNIPVVATSPSVVCSIRPVTPCIRIDAPLEETEHQNVDSSPSVSSISQNSCQFTLSSDSEGNGKHEGNIDGRHLPCIPELHSKECMSENVLNKSITSSDPLPVSDANMNLPESDNPLPCQNCSVELPNLSIFNIDG